MSSEAVATRVALKKLEKWTQKTDRVVRFFIHRLDAAIKRQMTEAQVAIHPVGEDAN
jgi:hypothetical protein